MKDNPKCWCYYHNHEWVYFEKPNIITDIKFFCDTCYGTSDQYAIYMSSTLEFSCNNCRPNNRSSHGDRRYWKKINNWNTRKDLIEFEKLIETKYKNYVEDYYKLVQYLQQYKPYLILKSFQDEYKAHEKKLDIYAENISLFPQNKSEYLPKYWPIKLKIKYLYNLCKLESPNLEINDMIYNKNYFTINIVDITTRLVYIKRIYDQNINFDVERSLIHYCLLTHKNDNQNYLKSRIKSLVTNIFHTIDLLYYTLELICIMCTDTNLFDDIQSIITNRWNYVSRSHCKYPTNYENGIDTYATIITNIAIKYDYAPALNIPRIKTGIVNLVWNNSSDIEKYKNQPNLYRLLAENGLYRVNSQVEFRNKKLNFL
jgi:hypothetical protein